MSTQQEIEIPAIELIVEQDKDGQVAANVPVRWKISEEMVQSLAKKTVEPFMLLVISDDVYELDRYLVPLKSGMTFLQMSRPGTLTIHATIVWQREGEDSVKKIVLAKNDHGGYVFEPLRSFIPGLSEVDQRIDELYEIIRWDAFDEKAHREVQLKRKLLIARRERLRKQPEVFGLIDGFRAIERTVESDQINIEVPEAMFAAEPPRWMIWLGTRYKWPRKAQDQCDLRRRALLTVLTAPVVVPVILVLGVVFGVVWLGIKLAAVLVTGVLLFFGKRNLDYSVIYEWDNIEIRDIWYGAKPSFWLYKKIEVERPHPWGENRTISETEYVRRDPAFDYINAPILVLFLGTRLTFSGLHVSSVLWGIGIPVILGLVFSMLTKWMLKYLKADDTKKSVVSDEQRSKMERELSLLTVDGSARLSDLPRQQRTVRLRYLDLKASVCKPFAR